MTIGLEATRHWQPQAEALDEAGKTSQASAFIWSNPYNSPPVIDLVVVSVNGLTVTVSAGGSSDPDQGTSWDGYLNARFDWEDDGIWDQAFSTAFQQAFTYAKAGTYTIRAQVRDRFGAMDTATVQVTVQ